MTKTYNVTLTEEQLKVIEQATELLARIQGGQIREVFDHLPLRKDMNWERYHEIQNEITKMMPDILKDGIDGWRSAFGVGSTSLPKSHDIAWDIYCTFRHHRSWEYAIDQNWVEDFDSPRIWGQMIGVNYDKPFHWSQEPLPIIQRTPE